MKKLILGFMFLSFIQITEYGNTKSSPHFGIIQAGKLNARVSPSVTSKVIKTFYFGTPVELINVSENSDIVDGIKDKWYQEKESKGWLFGGYLFQIKNEKDSFIGKVDVDVVVCNVAVDGNFASRVPYFIINGYYITRMALELYPPMDENIASEAIIIGKSQINNNLTFKPLMRGNYNSKGKFLSLEEVNSREYSLSKVKDDLGAYFIDINGKFNDGKKDIPRRNRHEAKEICKDRNFRIVDEAKPVFEIFYLLKKMNISDIQNQFPLIK